MRDLSKLGLFLLFAAVFLLAACNKSDVEAPAPLSGDVPAIQNEGGPTNVPTGGAEDTLTRSASVSVKSVIPAAGSADNPLRPLIEIEVEFIGESQDLCSYTIALSPSAQGDTLCQFVRNKVRFSLNEDLKPDTEYSITMVSASGAVLVKSMFRTMGGLALKYVFPQQGFVVPLDTSIKFEYSDEANLVTNIKTAVSIEKFGGEVFTTPSGEWKPNKLLNPGTEYNLSFLTEYDDKAGAHRSYLHKQSFLTPALFANKFEDIIKKNLMDKGNGVVFGPVSGDVYAAGIAVISDSPLLWFGRFSKGVKVWDRLFQMRWYSTMSSAGQIAVDKDEKNVYVITSSNIYHGMDQHLFKYDTNGEHKAEATFSYFNDTGKTDRGESDYGRAVAVDDNYVYVAGSVPIVQGNYSKKQISISAYDKNDLKRAWHTEIPINGDDNSEATAIKVGPDGNIYAAGYTGILSSGKTKFWFGKLDSAGKVIAENRFSAMLPAAGQKLYGIDVYDVGGTPYAYLVGGNGKNLVWDIYKYDSSESKFVQVNPSPQEVPIKELNATEGHGIVVRSVAGQRNLYVVGSTTKPDVTKGIFLRVYKEDGTVVGTLDASTTEGDAEGWDIDVNAAGEIIATGFAPFEANSKSAINIWLRMYDSDFFEQWTNSYDNPHKGYSTMYGLAVASDGDVVFDAEFGGNVIYGAKIMMCAKDGTPKWETPYARSSAGYSIWSLGIGPDKSVHVSALPPSRDNKSLVIDKFDSQGNLVWSYDPDVSVYGRYSDCYSIAGDADGYSYCGITNRSLKKVSIVKLCKEQSGNKCTSPVWRQDFLNNPAGYVKAIYPLSGGRLFVVIEDSNSSGSLYLRFYVMNASDGKGMKGESPPDSLIAPLEVLSSSQTTSTAMDGSGKVYFIWEKPSADKKTIEPELCSISVQADLNCFAKVNEPNPVYVRGVGDNGMIYGISWNYFTGEMMTTGVLRGEKRLSTLVIFNPDGSVYSRRTIAEGPEDFVSKIAVSPDNTILFGGRKFIGEKGIVGFLFKCDIHGNCLE